MSVEGLEQGVIDKGFQFAGEPVALAGVTAAKDQPGETGILFNATDKARLYAKVLGDLGMIADPDRANEVILTSMQELHDTLETDRLPEDDSIVPFFAIDLADREGAFTEGVQAFNNQLPGIPKLSVWPDFCQLYVEQLNRRSFAGETAMGGWGARAMVLGGDREDAPGLHFINMAVPEQIEAFKRLRTEYDASHPNSALGAMNFLDHLVINAAVREENESGDQNPSLDPYVYSRVLQVGEPKTGAIEVKFESLGKVYTQFVIPSIRSMRTHHLDKTLPVNHVSIGHEGGFQEQPLFGVRVSTGPKLTET